MLHKNGEIARLHANSMALGVLADPQFVTGEMALEPGDRLFLFTDGVTEAFNGHEQEYGEERLSAFLAKARELDDETLIEAIKNDVLAFCGPVRPRDDMTLMVVAREA